MFRTQLFRGLLAMSISLGLSTQASAGNIVSLYDVQPARGHVMWLPQIAHDFVFDENGGTFTEIDNGTAELKGRLVSQSDSSKIFDILFTYETRTETGTPKIECCNPDISNWHYYTDLKGTLTGGGSLAGTNLDAVNRVGMPFSAFQIGEGANGKNLLFGGSGWFTAFDPQTGLQGRTLSGDINITLTELPIPPVDTPTPAGLWLMLFGLGFLAKRRLKSA